ncbi:MAG: glycosyltransferase [Paludibacter sp.]|jgi:hypothetical protein|nr:glycosyltransferase [Paludibacter sp.]
MIKFRILVVVYKKLPFESSTIKALIDIKDKISNDVEIVIWDNSPDLLDEHSQQEFEKKISGFNYLYIADGKNTPLSAIYNQIIGTSHFDEYLVIFDDDTSFDFNYFATLTKAISQYPHINLFLPLIKYKEQIVSPANQVLFRGSYWKKKKTGVLKSKRITAINSGMAISTNYLKTKFKGYNEKLKFYETDNYFMYQFSKDSDCLFVMDIELNHILNFYEDISITEKLDRYRQQREGFLINMKERNFFVCTMARLYSFLVSVKLSLKYSDIRFVYKSSL